MPDTNNILPTATQRLRSERFCRKLNIPTRKAKVSQQTTAQKQADCRAGQVFARFRWAVLVRYKLARGVTKQADESVFLKLTVPLCGAYTRIIRIR